MSKKPETAKPAPKKLPVTVIAAIIGFFALVGAAAIQGLFGPMVLQNRTVDYTETAEAEHTLSAQTITPLPASETPQNSLAQPPTAIPVSPTPSNIPVLTDTQIPTIPPIRTPAISTSEICPPFDRYFIQIPLLNAALKNERGGASPGVRYSYQEYQRGHMFWNGAGSPQGFTIYVLFPQQGNESHGSWTLYDNPWSEETPQPRWIPPEPGLVQPIRGFGNIWIQNNDVREKIGWGLMDEISILVTSQSYPGGLIVCISTINTYTLNQERYLGATYALIDQSNRGESGYWVRLDK